MSSITLTNPQALNLWHRAMHNIVHDDGPDLSARQLAVLLTVYLTPPPHTVKGLAWELGVSKPVITRALDTLGQYGYLKRRRDEADRRNVLVERTTRGSAYLSDLSSLIVQASREA